MLGFGAVVAVAKPPYPGDALAPDPAPLEAPDEEPLETFAQMLRTSAEWSGDRFEDAVPVSVVLRCAKYNPTEAEIAEAENFCNGFHQWPEDVVERRNTDGRPTLVINRLPSLVHAAVTASLKIGELVSDDDERLVTFHIVQRNRDAQKIYNYMRSQMAEEVARFRKLRLNPAKS